MNAEENYVPRFPQLIFSNTAPTEVVTLTDNKNSSTLGEKINIKTKDNILLFMCLLTECPVVSLSDSLVH